MYVRTAIVRSPTLVDVQAARLAEAVRPRLTEAGCDRDDRRAHVSVDDLELVPLAHGRLVNVPREDQVGAGVDERAEHLVPVRHRSLARGAPRRTEHVMVEHGDANGAVRRRLQALGGVAQLLGAERSALVAVRARRVQADDVQALASRTSAPSSATAARTRPRAA